MVYDFKADIQYILPILSVFGLSFFTFRTTWLQKISPFLLFIPYGTFYLYCALLAFHLIYSHNYGSKGERINAGVLLLTILSSSSVLFRCLYYTLNRHVIKSFHLKVNKKIISNRHKQLYFISKHFFAYLVFLIVGCSSYGLGCYMYDKEFEWKYFICSLSAVFMGFLETKCIRYFTN